MPTKPGAAFIFATDVTFSSGPASGNNTKVAPTLAPGFIPGQGIAAEHVNYILNIVGDWLTNWVLGGTSSADEDAHIVETDVNGSCSIASLNTGGSGSAFAGLNVTGNSGGTNYALGVTASVPGVRGLVVAGVVDTDASQFAGLGTGNGITVFNDGSGSAIQAARNTDDGGPMLKLVDAASTPERGSLQFESQPAPTAAQAGDFWKLAGSAGVNRGKLVYHDEDGNVGSAGPLSIWATKGGSGHAWSRSVTTSTNTTSTPSTKTSKLLQSGVSQPDLPVGTYYVTFSCAVRLAVGAALTTQCKVNFVVSGTTYNRTFTIDFTSVSDWKPLSVTVQIPVDATPRTAQIDFWTANPTQGVEIADAEIFCRGAYD